MCACGSHVKYAEEVGKMMRCELTSRACHVVKSGPDVNQENAISREDRCVASCSTVKLLTQV